MGRTINDLSPLEIAFVQGFVSNDDARFYAVIRRHFEGLPLREVERETGLPKSVIHDLASRFAPVYGAWRSRNGSPERQEAKYRAYVRETVEEFMRQEEIEGTKRYAEVQR